MRATVTLVQIMMTVPRISCQSIVPWKMVASQMKARMI